MARRLILARDIDAPLKIAVSRKMNTFYFIAPKGKAVPNLWGFLRFQGEFGMFSGGILAVLYSEVLMYHIAGLGRCGQIQGQKDFTLDFRCAKIVKRGDADGRK